MIIVLKFMEDLELLEIVDEIFHAADSLNMSRNLVTLTDCACAIVTPGSGKTQENLYRVLYILENISFL